MPTPPRSGPTARSGTPSATETRGSATPAMPVWSRLSRVQRRREHDPSLHPRSVSSAFRPLTGGSINPAPSLKAETERWFIQRGVPHFISAYNATDDVLTRAAPILTLVFLFSAISAIDLDWAKWVIAVVSVVGLAFLLGAWMLLNQLRGRRLLARPDHIGGIEIGAFLLIPTALPLVFGGDLGGAGLTFLVLAVILAAVYAATSYGLVAISVWAVQQMFRTLGQTVRLFARSLPLLLLGFMFLFINAEAWQSAGRLDRPLLVSVTLLFVFLAGVFLVTQIPREMRGLSAFASWQEVEEWADDAPVTVAASFGSPEPDPPALDRRERGNLFLVFFVSQGFRLVLVSSMVGLFFVVLGLLIVRPETILLWTQVPPEVVWEFAIGGIDLTLTEELLRVSIFLGSFAGVYFSVYTVTDATLRTEFFEDTVAEARQNLAVRALYRSGN